MALIWRENQLVQTKKKKKLKGKSPWFGEPKCKLQFKVAHFFVFCFFHYLKKILVAQIL
jgi:hypothetical protein